MKRLPIDELLAAYASGGALSDEERTAVEALLDQSEAATREVAAMTGLFDQLRAAQPEPPAASEAVVRAVRIACAAPAPARGPLGWLRRRWAIALPSVLAAGAAAVLAIELGAPVAPEAPPRPAVPTAPTAAPDSPAGSADDALYLDGEAIVLGALDDDASDAIDEALDRELAGIADADDPELELDDAVGLLPDDNLDWVDELDDDAIDALDRWLAEQPS